MMMVMYDNIVVDADDDNSISGGSLCTYNAIEVSVKLIMGLHCELIDHG